jgi:hypothetical protein
VCVCVMENCVCVVENENSWDHKENTIFDVSLVWSHTVVHTAVMDSH